MDASVSASIARAWLTRCARCRYAAPMRDGARYLPQQRRAYPLKPSADLVRIHIVTDLQEIVYIVITRGNLTVPL
jgi:hypothetical protein